ncbi:hypothetical protein D9M68_721630 [compost metagenome]
MGQLLGQAGAQGSPLQAEVPALAEDLAQAGFVTVEQLLQLEGQHQVGQAPAVQLPDQVQQPGAGADVAEQRQAGELHQAFSQGRAAFQQGADLLGGSRFTRMQLAQAQGGIRHRRQRTGVIQKAFVEREFHGVVAIVHVGWLRASLIDKGSGHFIGCPTTGREAPRQAPRNRLSDD